MKKKTVEEFATVMVDLARRWMEEDEEGENVGVSVSFYPSGVIEVISKSNPLQHYRVSEPKYLYCYLEHIGFQVEDDRKPEGYDPTRILGELKAAHPDDRTGYMADDCLDAIEQLVKERDWLEGVLEEMQDEDVKYKLGYDDGHDEAKEKYLREGRMSVMQLMDLGDVLYSNPIRRHIQSHVGPLPDFESLSANILTWNVRTFVDDIDVDTLTIVSGDVKEGLRHLRVQLRKFIEGDWIPF